jgi:hypothetical protein
MWFCAGLAVSNGKNSETNCLVEARQRCRANWLRLPALAQGDFLVVVPVHTGAQHPVKNTRYNGQLQSRLRRHVPNSINEHTLHSNTSARPPTEIGTSQSRNTNVQITKRPRVSTPLWAVPRGAGYTWRHKSLQGPVIPNSGLEARDPHSGDGGTCSSILTALIPNVWNDSTSPKARD